MTSPPRNVSLLFPAIVDNVGGARAAARILHISETTIEHWINDQAPYMAAALLWWSSPVGQGSIVIDERNLIRTLRGLTDSLERQLRATQRECIELAAALDRAVGRIAANDTNAYGHKRINIAPAALLWWTSPIGRESIAVDERNLIGTLRGLSDSLQRRLVAAEREIEALRVALDRAGGRIAANDPCMWTSFTGTREPACDPRMRAGNGQSTFPANRAGRQTPTIQPMPNRSVTMPKRGDQKVLSGGICTLPPSASAAKTRSTAASSGSEIDNENPSNRLLSSHPSEAISMVSPMRKAQCMTLFSNPAGTVPGGGGSGLSLKRIIISTWAPSASR
jgi:hypothetical protein